MFNTATTEFMVSKLGFDQSWVLFDSTNKSTPMWTKQNPDVVLIDRLDEDTIHDIVKNSAVSTLNSSVITTDQILQDSSGYTQLMTSLGLDKDDYDLQGQMYTQLQNMKGDSTDDAYYIVTEIEGEEPLKGSPVCGILYVYSGSFADGGSATQLDLLTAYGLVGNELHRHVSGDKITYVHAVSQPKKTSASRYADRISIATNLDVFDQQANFKVNKSAIIKDKGDRPTNTTPLNLRINMLKDDGSGNRTPYTPSNTKPVYVSTAYGYTGYYSKAELNVDTAYEFKSIELDDGTESSETAYIRLEMYSPDFFDLSKTHKLTIEGQSEAVIMAIDERNYNINSVIVDKSKPTQDINLVWVPLAKPKDVNYKLNIIVEALYESTGEIVRNDPLFTDLLFAVKDGTNNLTYYPYYTKEPFTLTVPSINDVLNLKVVVKALSLPDNLTYTSSFQSSTEVTLSEEEGYQLPTELDTTLSATTELNIVDVIIKTKIADPNAPVPTQATVEPKYRMKLRNPIGTTVDVPVDADIVDLVDITLTTGGVTHQLKDGNRVTLTEDVKPQESPKSLTYTATVESVPNQTETGEPYELYVGDVKLDVGDTFDVPVQYIVGSTNNNVLDIELIGTKPLDSKTYTGSYTLDVHVFEQTDDELVDLGLNTSVATPHGITVDGTQTDGGTKLDFSETLTEDKPAPVKQVTVSVTKPQNKTTYVLPGGVVLNSENQYTNRFDLQLLEEGNDVTQTLTVTTDNRTQGHQMVGIVRIDSRVVRVDEFGNERDVALSEVPYLDSIMFHVGGSTMTASGFNATNDFYLVGYGDRYVEPMDMYPLGAIDGVDVLINDSLITEENKHTFDVTYADVDEQQIPNTVVPIKLRIGGASGTDQVTIPRDFSAVITPIVTTGQYDSDGDLIFMGSGHPYVQSMEIMVGDDVVTTFDSVVVTSLSSDFNPNGTITVAIKNPNPAFSYIINDTEGTSADVDVIFDNQGDRKYIEVVIILP